MRSADDELIPVLLDELVKRGQWHAPATNGIEVHLIALDVIPYLASDEQRMVASCDQLIL